MSRSFFTLLFVLSYFYSCSQESDAGYQNHSKDRQSFNRQLKSDSILSFRSKKGYVPLLVNNIFRQATFPIRLKGNDFIVLGGVAAVATGLFHYDQEIDLYFKDVKDENPFIKSVSPEITELGNYYGYIALAAYGTYSFAFHRHRGFRASLLASQALVSTGLWVTVFKTMSSRMRPEATYNDPEFNSDHWFGPFAKYNSKYNSNRGHASFESFFSGHTGAAFALAVVFSDEYKDMKAVPITLYSLAGIVAVTRLIEHQHWASDVFMGGIAGYFCGKQIISQERKMFPQYLSQRRKTINYFYPFSSNGKAGVGWRMIF